MDVNELTWEIMVNLCTNLKSSPWRFFIGGGDRGTVIVKIPNRLHGEFQ